MAVFGRRQPHAPIVETGLRLPQQPVGRAFVFGQKTSQASADRFYRRSFPPKIIRAGGRPSVAHALVVSAAVARAADAYSRRSFPPTQKSARLPAQPPVGDSLTFGQKASQAAADRFYRRSFPPILRGVGPPRAVAQVRVVSAAVARAADRSVPRSFPPIIKRAGGRALPPARSQVRSAAVPAAADRFYRRSFPAQVIRAGGRPSRAGQLLRLAPSAYRPARRPVWVSPAPPPPTVVIVAPVGRLFLAGVAAAQAADRYSRRSFPAQVIRAGGPAAVARALVASVANRLAADRAFHRPFAPIIRRAGGPPAAGRQLLRLAPSAYRPARQRLYVSPAPPAPVAVTVPIGKIVLVGNLAARAAAHAAFRHSFPAVIKRAGGQPAVGGQLLRLAPAARAAADRYYRRSFPPILRRAGGPPATGGQLLRLAPSASRPSRQGVFFVPAIPPPPAVVPFRTFSLLGSVQKVTIEGSTS